MKSFPRWLIVASVLAMMVLIGGGYWFYLYQEQVLRQNAEANLQAAAHLKVNQIAEWRSEQIRDAAVIMESPFFTEAAVQCITEPKADLTDKLLARFRSMQEHFQYRDVMLVDRNGQVRLSLNKHIGSLHEDAARSLAEALRTSKPVVSDLHVGPADLPPHIDVVVPIFSETGKTKEPVGAVILQIDARKFLYPLIQFWPTPSRSAETLLVRKEGDAVLFLNDLRHQQDTALNLRIPLSRKDVPAVMAVLGKEGIVQGKDYRGVNVLSVLKAIPNSPWFMVAKMDEAEALADLRFRSILILALVIGLLTFLVAAVGVVWQKTGKAHYKELFLAETALRKAEEGHRITLMSVGDGIISTDVDGRVEILNPVAEALTGWSQEEACGKPLEEVFRIFNEETRQPVKSPVSKVLKEGLVVGLATSHTVILAREGTERPIADSAAPIRDERGAITGVVLVFRDQSEQRAAQRLLVQEKQKAQQYLDVAGVMLLALDTNGHVTLVNKKGCEILGYQEGDVLGKDWFEHFLPDKVRDEVEGFFSRIISGHLETDEYVESIVLASSGEARIIGWHNSVLRDQDGSITGTFSSGEDITDREKAEEALRESEERHRILIEHIPQRIFLKDRHSVYLSCNANYASNLGIASEQIVGKDDFDFHPPELAQGYRADDQECMATGMLKDIEEPYRLAGKDRWAHTIKVPYRDREGQVVGVLGIFEDITDRKRTEELALQAARLKSVADLSSGVAHHFNNLLQIVMASTSLSLADLESGDLSEIKINLEKMLRAATLGAETVKRLQTFSNVRADVTESESDVFDVATTARNAAEISKPLWKLDPEKKGIKIDLQLDLEDGCLVKGQENEMFEVFVNLIRNAAEALLLGGDVEVKTYKEVNEVVVTVRDSGIGIAEEDLPRVFQPFWSSKGVAIGKGMGLAVTHGLVKRHCGTISVESNLGVGTTFTIRLPLAHEPVRKTEEPAMRPAEGHLTILVIDDDLNIASLLERIIAKAGHRVFSALSGQEGLAIFNKEPVDLVISDLGMPGMTGWDVGKAIRSTCQERGVSKTPFILLTGYGCQELGKAKITESGVDGVVAKPVDRATVLATVQQIADRNRGDRGRFS